MVNIVLIVVYFLAALIAIKIGILIFLHFKKFDLPDGYKVRRILSIFKWGSIILLLLGFIFLILILTS